MTQEDIKNEIQKCKDNPYYFATKYLRVGNQPFTTHLSEKEFNEHFKDPKTIFRSRTRRSQ